MPTVTIGANTGNTFTGVVDAKLVQSTPTANYGSNGSLEIGKYSASNWQTVGLKFPGLSNITGPVTVTAATLRIYLYSYSGSMTLTVKRLLRDWVGDQVTWNVYSTGNSWTTGGALGDATDRSSTVTTTKAPVNPDDTETYVQFTSAQLIQDVQDWINGVNDNYGWHLEATQGENDSLYAGFRSSESTDLQRPYLEVEYTSGEPTLAVTITTNSGANYSTSNTTTDLAGTSSLATSVTWANDRGGSGSASYADDAWTITGIALSLGANVITVTAHDNGNTAADTITVTRTVPGEDCRGFDTIYGAGTTDRIVSALTAHAATRTYAIWAYRGATDSTERMFDKRISGAQVELLHHVSGTTTYEFIRQWSGGAVAWTVAMPNAEEWHHITVTYDYGSSSNSPIIYVDGISVTVTGTPPGAGSITNNSDNYVIGNRGGGDRPWNGMLCEFAVWDRILDLAEIQGLGIAAGGYLGKSPLYYPTSLVEYIPMTDDPVTSSVISDPTVTGTLVKTALGPAIDYPTASAVYEQSVYRFRVDDGGL